MGTGRSPEGGRGDETGQPAVSVVLPVRNEVTELGRLLAELRDQQPPPGGYEVLVADGGSTDGTRDLVLAAAREWPGLRLIDNPRVRSGPGRNAGARVARGRYVLFVDGHCAIRRRDYLRRLVEVFEETGADCLARPQPLDLLARGAWGKAIARARHSRLGHDPGSDIYGAGAAPTDPRSAGAAYRREVLCALGGYDERFDACEDVEFNHRVAEAGYRSYVHPDLAVDYRPREGLGPFWRQMLRYGRGRGRLFARHPRLVPWPILGATGLGVGILIAAVALGKAGIALLVGGAGLWALALLVEGIRLGGPGGGGFRVALALAVIQIGLTAGFWRGAAEFPAYRPPAEPVLS